MFALLPRMLAVPPHQRYLISLWETVYSRAYPQGIAYIVSLGIRSADAILGQSYCGVYCIIDLVINVSYHLVYVIDVQCLHATCHHQMLAAD